MDDEVGRGDIDVIVGEDELGGGVIVGDTVGTPSTLDPSESSLGTGVDFVRHSSIEIQVNLRGDRLNSLEKSEAIHINTSHSHCIAALFSRPKE